MWKMIAAAGAAAAGGCLRSSYERKNFVTDVFELTSKKVTRERTFVFLSDLHDNRFGQGQGKLLEAVHKVHPCGVMVGGDMMVVKKEADLETALFLVGKLAERYPVYYGNGNHESRMDRKRYLYGHAYDRFVGGLKKRGVCHLADASVDFDDEVRISGLDIERGYYDKRVSPDRMEVSYIEGRLGKASEGKYQILLAHSPLFYKTYGQWGADLTLCGHFHGGTIRIPGLGGLMTPQFHFFEESCGGHLKAGDRDVVVSRGLGTHSINVRINNRAELVVVKIKPEIKRDSPLVPSQSA